MKPIAYLIFLAGCGGSAVPAASSGNVNETGGSLALGAMTVDIPAGALTSSTAFALTAVDNADVVAGLSYRVEADVAGFTAPARVTFSLPAGIGLPLDELFVAQLQNGAWLALDDAAHLPASHDGTHDPHHAAAHGGPDDSAPHDHVAGSAHAPGHFGVVHCPHGVCPHH